MLAERTPIHLEDDRRCDADRARCREAGMDHFIAKPIELPELRRVVEGRAEPVSSTANLFSMGESPGARILSHPQVVEDGTRPEREFAHHFGDGLGGFLK